MNSAQRRGKAVNMLWEESRPLSATAIAKGIWVSRQIIVGDVALLRAAGERTSQRPRKDMFTEERSATNGCLRHNNDKEELYIVVDNGCAVLDVTVEHPVYGQILGQLQIFSRYDADQFAKTGRKFLPPLYCPDQRCPPAPFSTSMGMIFIRVWSSWKRGNFVCRKLIDILF